jgi:hypothetical protein
VVLTVDYSVPVDQIRQKFNEIVHESRLWDGKVASLQVTDAPDSKAELRALVSARNPGQSWDLRCEVREKLITFVQAEFLHPPQILAQANCESSTADGKRAVDASRSGGTQPPI